MEIFEKIAMVLIIVTFVMIIVSQVLEIIASRRYYKKMEAELELYRGTLKKNHELTHAVVEFGDWLIEEKFEELKKKYYDKGNNYNKGAMEAAEEIVAVFLSKLEKHTGDWNGKESSD